MIMSLEIALRSAGITNLKSCQDSREVLSLVSDLDPAVILMDLTMPHITGDQLLAELQVQCPGIPVVIITGNNELETAVHCMKIGAFDYILKPAEKNRLVTCLTRALEHRELTNENMRLKERVLSKHLENPAAFSKIVTADQQMKSIFQYAEAISKSSQPVLITGESGVGKELMADAIHTLSGRSGGFVPVNVAGIDDQAFSDTLFGHVKGAFTGADTLRQGLLTKAAGGTIFLDEIGDLAPESQVKLLRLIQEREYYPLGADLPKSTDAKIVVATNRELRSVQDAGSFRKDLYFRLTAHQIHIPPLRDRIGDLPLLLDHFFDEAARDFGKKKPAYPDELIVLLKNYHFPGNIRELRAMVFDALAGHQKKKISMSRFKDRIDRESEPGLKPNPTPEIGTPAWFPDNAPLPTLAEANQALIEIALKRTDDNRSMAARLLGISRQRLLRHLKSK
jgi:DNA-binding NtrC family response regulator